MRFVMSCDDTLRDGSIFGRKFIVLNFHFYWYCLSFKANFQKKIPGNTSTKGFLGLTNQVLAFVTFFSYSIKHFFF